MSSDFICFNQSIGTFSIDIWSCFCYYDNTKSYKTLYLSFLFFGDFDVNLSTARKNSSLTLYEFISKGRPTSKRWRSITNIFNVMVVALVMIYWRCSKLFVIDRLEWLFEQNLQFNQRKFNTRHDHISIVFPITSSRFFVNSFLLDSEYHSLHHYDCFLSLAIHFAQIFSYFESAIDHHC